MKRTWMLSLGALSFSAALGCDKATEYQLPSAEEAREIRQRAGVVRRDAEPPERRTRLVRFPTAGDAAADALARIGKPALPALIEALESKNAPTRARAVRAIGMMEESDPQAIEALSTALRDPDASVREQAARALGHIGPPARAAVPELIELLAE